MSVDIFRRVIEGLIDEVKGRFRSERRRVDQIFALKQKEPKARARKQKVYVGFMDLEKTYDRVNREALWQGLRMYDVGDKLLN